MNNVPSIFPLWYIALTAATTSIISFIVLLFLQRRTQALSFQTILWLSLLAGLSVLFWRSASNVAQLDNDPIPPFSTNDLICPIVTYIVLELAAACLHPIEGEHWEKTRASLTLVSFLVNVLVI
jgi:hypothetical protein